MLLGRIQKRVLLYIRKNGKATAGELLRNCSRASKFWDKKYRTYYNQSNYQDVRKAIGSLYRRGIIKIKGGYYTLGDKYER